MSADGELIVLFKRGTTEAEAHKVLEKSSDFKKANGVIRRRMRSDHEDQVMLLLRLDSAQLNHVHRCFAVHAKVAHAEVNGGGYSIS